MRLALSSNGPMPPRPSREMHRAHHPGEGELGSSMAWSVGLHVAVALFAILKGLVFPSEPTPYIPALRVDVVGLPDLLKKDMANLQRPSLSELENQLKRAEQQVKDIKLPAPTQVERSEPADPSEMVLKPKKATETKDRQKKLKNALERIKSLDKIAQLESKERQEKTSSGGPIIKGNQVSRGTSLTGEARESAQATYFDLVRDTLQSNWTLNAWLARQKYSARVQIFIDSRGMLRSYRFLKPSGNTAFDDAVKAALMRSQPLPVPPEGIAGSVLTDGISVGFPL